MLSLGHTFFSFSGIYLKGSALGSMVGKLTYGKRQWENLDAKMRAFIPPLHDTAESMIAMIDEDTIAFSDFMVSTN